MSNTTTIEKIAGNQQIVVFRLGDEEYGLKIDQIKEVVITPAITRMPQSPEYIKGVANIRGNVLAIIDLEEKFGLHSSEGTSVQAKDFTLVIESEDLNMGVLVKDVPNTLSVSLDSIETSVFGGDGIYDQNYITGVVKLEKRLIILIDIMRVMTEQDTSRIMRNHQASV